jgi:hypothetical protein
MARSKVAEVVVKPPKLGPVPAMARLSAAREKILKAIAPGRLTEDEAEALHYEVEGALEDALGEGNEGIGRVLYAGRNTILDVNADTEADEAKTWKLRADLLDKLVERLKSNIADAAPPAPAVVKSAALEQVERLVLRFHGIAKQLRDRHDDRPTLDIKDEYDVQDLLHALLRLHFDDIREEEWTPSYAGASSRMDFLLKEEQLVIEVKMTRDGLGKRELGEQLIIDIARYRAHPDCKTLVCFVYDPLGRIPNPAGIENDLSGVRDGLKVKVFIAPKT